ncbi:hypothetical protein EDEG_02844 [Edhazardia aedis USNM 41457]|uniref:Uncharacterized protein n=1 Tax=Edhazardia aedis (strain USNM 41457) TaxID=1003232 RepID=J9D4M0_EDHAE|nr:hypothetical protein EDEG_02844 [Edhazardia aedis USNM 41457]|eukprot:EJW02751.1 hypothetical protein EDEG_02844 [Edhazardia aedis USNM 41457]
MLFLFELAYMLAILKNDIKDVGELDKYEFESESSSDNHTSYHYFPRSKYFKRIFTLRNYNIHLHHGHDLLYPRSYMDHHHHKHSPHRYYDYGRIYEKNCEDNHDCGPI